MTSLPPLLRDPLEAALRAAGDSTPVRAFTALGGGSFGQPCRLETGQARYFLKWSAPQAAAVPPGMFTAEAYGLALLAASGAVRVPQVYACAEAQGSAPALLLTEYLQGDAQPVGDGMAALGEQLAALHRASAAQAYGLAEDNFIGASPQVNAWLPDWVEFFTARRLRPQIERAAGLSAARRTRLERLLQRLPDLLAGIPRRPSLLHGDLWGGNVIPAPGGLALIDPAVYYGDREAELAFTHLFGGFTPSFYAAYQAAWPLEPGFEGRIPLYNLYHLLNHLNLFGSAYLSAVDAVLNRYV